MSNVCAVILRPDILVILKKTFFPVFTTQLS
uniref:Uncharacterized protein n=1 Tax=Anguilla anguilla TaxID=7936 RepID=A0A0E9QLL7_ANGAN